MERGSFVAASGGLLQLRKLELVNNNLANVNTPGFKGQYLVSRTRTFDETLASKMNINDPFAKGDQERAPEATSVSTFTDFSPGPIKSTGNPLDVALRNPNDFFVINGPNGPQYTRAGNFTMNKEGELVTQDGAQVQGDGGAISIDGANVQISSGGSVLVNGVQTARLQVVRFAEPGQLQHLGQSRFTAAGKGAPVSVDDPDLIPQSLEMSNVSAIESMIQMISANRGFEMYTKSAKTIDELNQTAITSVGRPR